MRPIDFDNIYILKARYMKDEHKTYTLSVIIPVYNERDTVTDIVELVEQRPEVDEIILVDDGSDDGTRERLESLKDTNTLKIVSHNRNKGKGAAIRTGLTLAKGDIILIQDADLEYSPSDYPQLLAPILSGNADVVFGSRFLGGPHRVLYFWHYVGNRFLTLLSNMVNNINLTDMEVCYKVFRREFIENITLTCNRFGFEPEITSKIVRQRARIYEVPISYYGRTYDEGKKIDWKDGVAAIWWILRFAVLP